MTRLLPMNAPGTAGPLNPRLAAALLLAAVVVAYLGSLRGAFVWDDVPTILENPAIEHFSTAIHRPAAVNTTSGRPLIGLSLAANYALGGRSPVGYHLFNLLIHAAAALTLFGFVRRLARLPGLGGRFSAHATELALAISAIWALHPLQTQAVAYVIQRAESLMGLCYLLTLYCFIRSTDSPTPRLWLWLSVASCAVGMTAKEVMASAPLAVLLFDRAFVSGSLRQGLASKRFYYAALGGTWLILAALVASLGGNRDGSTGGLALHAPWVAYWLTQFPALATYLKLTFFPHPLIFQYGEFWLPNAWAAIPYATVVVPVVAAAAFASLRWPQAGFFGFWFFAVLAATSLVPGKVDMIVEYRMYLALAPLWILVAAGLYGWRPRMAFALLGVAALAFAALTVARIRDYRSQLALWTDNVAHRPDNALARFNLASALLRESPSRTADAQAQLEVAVRLRPDMSIAHYNLAILLAQQPGHEDQAIAHLEEAVRIAPAYSQAHNNLAVILEKQGKIERAGREFELAVRYDPTNRSAWLNLVQVLVQLRRSDEAAAACTALVSAFPDFARGQAELGLLLVGRQHQADALPHLEAALRLDPSQWDVRFLLGTTLIQLGERVPEAVQVLESVVRQNPNSANARLSLGTAYLADGGRLKEAMDQFVEAVRLDPRLPDAHYNLAAALEVSGSSRTEAITHYRAAVALDPENAENHFRLGRILSTDPGSREEAAIEIHRALAINPSFPGARALLGQLGE